eukprot:g55158.t1
MWFKDFLILQEHCRTDIRSNSKEKEEEAKQKRSIKCRLRIWIKTLRCVCVIRVLAKTAKKSSALRFETGRNKKKKKRDLFVHYEVLPISPYRGSNQLENKKEKKNSVMQKSAEKGLAMHAKLQKAIESNDDDFLQFCLALNADKHKKKVNRNRQVIRRVVSHLSLAHLEHFFAFAVAQLDTSTAPIKVSILDWVHQMLLVKGEYLHRSSKCAKSLEKLSLFADAGVASLARLLKLRGMVQLIQTQARLSDAPMDALEDVREPEAGSSSEGGEENEGGSDQDQAEESDSDGEDVDDNEEEESDNAAPSVRAQAQPRAKEELEVDSDSST